MNSAAPPAIRLIDLRKDFQPAVLEQFIALYEHTFTDPSEKEDPTKWAAALQDPEPKSPQPVRQLQVVVKNGPTAEVLGGAVFEYYQESRCGLLSYLAVDASARRQGVARTLMNSVIAKLEEEAKSRGETLRAVVAETANPGEVPAGHDSMDAEERLRAMAALGAMKVEIPYVQPELEPGQGRAYHLILISFGQPGRSFIESQVVTDFLNEYYRSLGTVEPSWDLDYLRILRAMPDPIPLKPLI